MPPFLDLAYAQVMHTRVYSQGSVLALLISLMLFKDYMDRHGQFLEEGEAQERAQWDNPAFLSSELIKEAGYLKKPPAPSVAATSSISSSLLLSK